MSKKKIAIKKISKYIASAASALVLILALAIFINVMVDRANKRTPTVFGYSFHIVATGSMAPEINVKDLVIAKRTDISTIKVGDDIVFVTSDPALKGMKIVHRVVAINSDGSFMTQGIHNTGADSYSATNIVGKVVAVSPALGAVLSKIGSNKNILFIIVLVVIVIVIALQASNVVIAIKSKKLDERNATPEATAERNKIKAELTAEIKAELLKELQDKDENK